MPQPTFYCCWPSERDGWVHFAVWDARVFTMNEPPGNQLDRCLFHDEMAVSHTLRLGASIINLAVKITEAFALQQRQKYVERMEREHHLDPTSPAELAKLSVWSNGLAGLDFDLPEPEVS